MNFSARRKIIFDMDGVITSEERYWDAAALTVWELLFSGRFLCLRPVPGLPDFKTDLSTGEIAAVRRVIFCHDEVITFFKERAVNSNWDLAFLTFSFQLLLLAKYLASRGFSPTERTIGEKMLPLIRIIRSLLSNAGKDGWSPSFEAVLSDWPEEARGGELIEKLRMLLPAGYGQIFGDEGSMSLLPLWKDIQEIFQEWYLGEEASQEILAKKTECTGKDGLIYREEPLIEVPRVKATLRELSRQGWALGIATGRPMNELKAPLEQMGIWSYFQHDSVVTFDQVAKAEKELRISLGKPHPYSFLKAYWGGGKNDRELVSFAPPPQQGMCWIVGDTLADLLAAKGAGASFIGVLTGHNGQRNMELFRKEGAEAVLPDITGLPAFFAKCKL